MDLVVPRRLTRIVRAASRTTWRAARGIPLLATVLSELRDSAKHLERLAVYATQELPEIVYQLERVRDQLAAIERRLSENTENTTAADTSDTAAQSPVESPNGVGPQAAVSRGSRRSG